MSEDIGLKAVFGADTSDYDAAVNKCITSINDFGNKAQQATSQGSSGLVSLGGSLKSLVSEFLPAIGAAMALAKTIELGKDAFEEYGKHVDAINDLGAALTALGTKNVPGALKQEEAFADSMQEATNVSRDQILALEGQAAAMGVHQDRLEETTKAAMGLSKVYGIDMRAALEYVVRAQQGNTTMLSRYIPELKNAGSAADKYAIILGKAQVGLNVLSAETESGTGPLKKLQNSWNDFMEKVGEVLARGLNPLFEKLNEFMPVIEGIARIIKDFIESALTPVITAFEVMYNTIMAIIDAMNGDFSKAWIDLKQAAKDGVDGVTQSLNNWSKTGTDVANTFIDGFNIASKGNPPKIEAPQIGPGGGAKDQSSKDPSDKIKSLTEIIDEAKAHMTSFGETRLTAINTEIKEIQNSMQKLFDKGLQGTKQFQDLAAALNDVKFLSEATKTSEAYLKATPKDLSGIDITQPDGKAVTETAPDNGKMDAGITQIAALEKQQDTLKEIDAMAKQAQASIALFGGTDLSRLNASLLAVENQMIQLKAAGQDMGTPWDNLVKQQQQLKAAIDSANSSMQTQSQLAKQGADALGGVVSVLAKGVGEQKADMGTEILKQLGALAEKKGEFYISMGALDLLALNPMGGVELAAGTALVALGAKLSATKMAAGGVVSGSAFVNVGEYPGAAHNPEVIAPLDKLNNMMGNKGGGNHTFTVEGPKLVTVMNKVNTNTMFHIGGGGA